LFRVAIDAFLVADGIFTHNNSLVGLGLGDYLLFTSGLPSNVQSQLQTAFVQGGFADLLLLHATG
jgi:hypothetical protein